MEDLYWDSNDASLVVAIGTATVCFSVYWFVAYSASLKQFVDKRKGDGHFHHYGAFYQKAIGILCLGIVPAAISYLYFPKSFTSYGVGVASMGPTLYWMLLFGGFLSFIPWYSARKEEMQRFYPQVRVPEWDRKLLLINGLFWLSYLFAYEFLFRGFLLLNTAEVLGWWPGIIVTTAICTLTHMPKGSKETFGTIPLSIILCLIVVQTGAIWACVVVHAALAISNDFWAASFNPDMQIKSGKSVNAAKSLKL
ncbi:MAG: lysostaphin resistance A-like protein [Rhodothermales bacterium]